MRQVFVKNLRTSLFLTATGDWAADPRLARDFGTSLNALAHCLRTGLPDVIVLIRFNKEGIEDVCVPVEHDVWEERPSPADHRWGM